MKTNRLSHCGIFLSVWRRLAWQPGPGQAQPEISLQLAGGCAAKPGPCYTSVTVPRAHTVGSRHTCCVFLHRPGTDPHFKKGSPESSEAGLPWPPGHAVLGVRLGPKQMVQGQRQHAWLRACHQLISVTAAAVKGF